LGLVELVVVIVAVVFRFRKARPHLKEGFRVLRNLNSLLLFLQFRAGIHLESSNSKLHGAPVREPALDRLRIMKLKCGHSGILHRVRQVADRSADVKSITAHKMVFGKSLEFLFGGWREQFGHLMQLLVIARVVLQQLLEFTDRAFTDLDDRCRIRR